MINFTNFVGLNGTHVTLRSYGTGKADYFFLLLASHFLYLGVNKLKYVLKTNADFFYVIATGLEVLVLSKDLITRGKIILANDIAVLIGDEYYLRGQCEFFVEIKRENIITIFKNHIN